MNSMLIGILDADRRRALENVREAAARIWSRPLHRYYTDHTVAHSERVIALLDGLTAGMMATDRRLSPTEVFCLLAAVYLHDIGMQNEKFAEGDLDEIRAHHNEQTAEMIYAVFEDPARAFAIPLARDPGLVEAVALVARGHRQVDLHAAEYEPFVHGGEVVRLRLLAALLRFGDELDIDHRRVDLEQMKLLALPAESQLHWWKCHYVSGVSIVDEYIKIAYRLPQDRPDYEALIVPLVEGEVRAKHAALEEIFRAHAVKVALGPSQVRPMRLVQPLPPEVEALAQNKSKAADIRTAKATWHPNGIREANAEQTQQGEVGIISAEGLQLAIYDPNRDELTNQLTLFVPHTPADGQRKAAQRGFRLYLLNNSGKMTRYIQVEMYVQAVFLAYPYHRFPPLLIDPPGRWKIAKSSDDTFRCFFEGGADLACHAGKHYDLGYVGMRVPHGEADGGVVPVNIGYEIAAEEHRGSGSLVILLQADASVSVHQDKVEVPATPSSPSTPATLFDQRGQTVGTQINVAGDARESQPPTSGATYHVHIEHATGIAIGDQARVESSSSDRPPPGKETVQEDTFAPEDERAALQRELARHKRNLYKLREQAAIYAAGETPLHLLNQIEVEEREIRRIAAELEDLGR